jgi:membrane fusion protein, multidrug efflux system
LAQVLEQTHGGKSLEVDAYDRTQQKLLSKGKLITIDNQIDTVTGTVKLRAQFNNPGGSLFPNEFVNTRLLVKTLDNQILLPSSAIQHNGNTDFVYLIQGLNPNAPPPSANGGNGNGGGSSGGGGHHGGGGSGASGGKGGKTGTGSGSGNVGKAIMRTVKSGISDGGNTSVTGINAGDIVANSSFQKLVNGSQVTLSSVTIPATTDTSEGAP